MLFCSLKPYISLWNNTQYNEFLSYYNNTNNPPQIASKLNTLSLKYGVGHFPININFPSNISQYFLKISSANILKYVTYPKRPYLNHLI